MTRLTLCLFTAATMSLGSSPQLRAQDSGALIAKNPAVPICLVNSFQSVPQTPDKRRGKRYRIVVPAELASDLEARGFSRRDCESLAMLDDARQRQFRNETCAMAAYGNEAVQNQITNSLGVEPAILCAGAERIAGPWEGQEPAIGSISIFDEDVQDDDQ